MKNNRSIFLNNSGGSLGMFIVGLIFAALFYSGNIAITNSLDKNGLIVQLMILVMIITGAGGLFKDLSNGKFNWKVNQKDKKIPWSLLIFFCLGGIFFITKLFS